MKLLKTILTLLLGYKYRAVILKDRGVERYWICSYIYDDTEQGKRNLKEYMQMLETSVKAHVYYETVTFRSRKPYAAILAETLADHAARKAILSEVKKNTDELQK